MSLIKSIATVGGHTMISRILGYIRDSLIAYYVGANAISDAIQMSIKIPSLFRRLFAEGAFNAAFVPMFSAELATKGKDAAKNFAEQSIVILSIFLIFLVILVQIFLPEFVGILAPGLEKTSQRFTLILEFTRVTFPFIIFISMCAILGGVLNSLERFAAPASASSIGNLCIITTLYLFVNVGKTPGHVVSWGFLMCSILQFIWLYAFCIAAGMPLKLRKPQFTTQMREFFQKLLPGMIGAGILQINVLVDTMMCSYLPVASISYMNNADRINQLPLGIVGVAMGIVLLPLLSKQFRQELFEEAISTQNRATEFVLLLTIPSSIALYIYAKPFVAFLYGHGKFMENPENIIQTANTLSAFSLGLPAYVLVKVFSSSFFARRDTVTPVVIGLISVLLNIGINLLLMDKYQHVGIAFGTAISSWVNVILLFMILRKRKSIVLDQQILKTIPKILLSALIMGIVIYFIQPYFIEDIEHKTFFYKMSIVFILITVGISSFLIPSYFLKCIHVKNIIKK